MNELMINVRIENDLMITDSRNIAEVFKKQHKHVLESIRNLEKDMPNFRQMFFEGVLPDSYGREQKVYFMNRDGFSLLAMGFTGSEALCWKLKYINAFNQLEKAWNTPEQVMARAIKLADQTIHKLQLTIDQQKPLVDFATAVAKTDSDSLIDMGKMAKILNDEHIKVGRNRLFAILRDNKILMSNNIPYQKYIDKNYFRVKEVVIDKGCKDVVQQVTMITGKGQLFIINHMRKEYAAS